MLILGISAYYHDSAVAIIRDDSILFALQEERLSRIKGDSRFPRESITAGLNFLATSGDYTGGGEMKKLSVEKVKMKAVKMKKARVKEIQAQEAQTIERNKMKSPPKAA